MLSGGPVGGGAVLSGGPVGGGAVLSGGPVGGGAGVFVGKEGPGECVTRFLSVGALSRCAWAKCFFFFLLSLQRKQRGRQAVGDFLSFPFCPSPREDRREVIADYYSNKKTRVCSLMPVWSCLFQVFCWVQLQKERRKLLNALLF